MVLVHVGIAHVKAIRADTAWEAWTWLGQVTLPSLVMEKDSLEDQTSQSQKGRWLTPEGKVIASVHPEGTFCNGSKVFIKPV